MINLRLYLENIAGDWFGWIEDFPGAFAQGATTQEAAHMTPRAFTDYLTWLNAHGEVLPAELKGATSADFNPVIIAAVPETADAVWATRHRLPEDVRAMDEFYFDRCLRLLRHARSDLSEAVHAIPPHEWDSAPLGEQSIRAMLQHVAHCETSMLLRIGIERTVRQHPDPWATLLRTRAAFESAVQDAFTNTGGAQTQGAAEQWSLSQVLRLAIWNERRTAERVSVRSNPTAYLRSVAIGVAVVRQRDMKERIEHGAAAPSEAMSLARHTHESVYYY